MPLFRVEVASKETGRSEVLEIQAKSETNARLLAFDRGYVVGSVTRVRSRLGAGGKGVMIGAAILVVAVFAIGTLRHTRVTEVSEPAKFVVEFDEIRNATTVTLVLDFKADKAQSRTLDHLSLTFIVKVEGQFAKGEYANADYIGYRTDLYVRGSRAETYPLQLHWLVDGNRMQFVPEGDAYGIWGAASVDDLRRIASSKSAKFTADGMVATFILNDDDRIGLRQLCSYLKHPEPPKTAPRAPYHPGK